MRGIREKNSNAGMRWVLWEGVVIRKAAVLQFKKFDILKFKVSKQVVVSSARILQNRVP